MLEMLLPDGNVRKIEQPMTVTEFAKTISLSLGKETIGAIIDGVQVDPSHIIEKSGSIKIITSTSEEGVAIIRHSAAHIMAQAVQKLFPGTKVTIGPVIENGFFYDFDPEKPFTEEDLTKIEEEMKKIVKENYEFKRSEMSAEDAKKLFAEMGENYKVEIIDDLGVDKVSIYQQGEFVDLCRGTHIPSTGYLKAFKLMSTAGAYWRGNSDNKMLQRIYGVAFGSKKELEDYLTMLEEAERRDHRKLGKQMDLFFLDEHGPGFPFFMPKGMELMNKLQEIWRKEHKKRKYEEIRTPVMLDKELWEISGHWFNYRENMYTSEIDEKVYAIKPMNCPGSIIAYKNNLHSYKDLPLKYGEMGLVHRHEFSGALHGLMRVRAFTQDDAHVFCTKEQIEEQIIEIIDLYDKFYTLFGFDYNIELSTKPEKAIGSDEIWAVAEADLASALEKKGIKYKLNPGDGAFYGPKIDFKMRDSIGRIWQCGTIQLDFNLPARFEMSYIGADGEKHEPVMIHRAMYGSMERFIGILIEHYAGAFPTWLAPVQARILTISKEQVPFAEKLYEELQEAGIRVDIDTRDEKIGYKIREANGDQKIPVQLIIGKNEVENNEVNVRRFGSQDSQNVSVKEIVDMLLEESKVPFKN
ncbi:threonine--tRNA ligase [Pseudoleptotrichia goodfellowii]|uniref:Threonine--tRNA ligase n=1 Tax=Pseudoleptotrichia goodfellowii F0264 TaxID=596323 RepID=D0GMH7_9FUSO|nr:threonine--tRNA ligase [Pseudoleptotrichia goodfellowii]EEY34702.1 threonine--tRNA ligase [Pseudoleptotrichia goodfellowii F0264]